MEAQETGVLDRGLSFSGCDGALRAIALGVCDYITDTSGCPKGINQLPFEDSIIRTLEGIFRDGAQSHSVAKGVDVEALGTAAAWAIFGVAKRWYQRSSRTAPEEMAKEIERLVKPIFEAAANH